MVYLENHFVQRETDMTDEDVKPDNVIQGVPFGESQGKCPECSSMHTVPILYGYPMEEAMDEARRGKIELGGCVIHGDDPRSYCKDCHHRW
ncbi:MAG: hypothetical protein GY916_03725 [Gammaproteobacteria bacterium]|nr:hypothetical protein [Gammaproteobacteria bacterium]